MPVEPGGVDVTEAGGDGGSNQLPVEPGGVDVTEAGGDGDST